MKRCLKAPNQTVSFKMSIRQTVAQVQFRYNHASAIF